MNKHSIITADDHPLLLKGLNDFLLEKKYNLIGSGNNGREAYKLITEDKPDYLVRYKLHIFGNHIQTNIEFFHQITNIVFKKLLLSQFWKQVVPFFYYF